MSETTSCPICHVNAETRTCVDCGRTATVIDCGHYAQPAEISASQHDGAPVCEACEAVRDAEADTASAEDVVTALDALTDDEREAIERAADAVLLHTHAVGGIGQTTQEMRAAAAAVAALPERARRLCAAAVPVWCAGVSDLWLSASVNADGEAEPTTATLDELIADDDELSGLQTLVLATGELDTATDLRTALDREAK